MQDMPSGTTSYGDKMGKPGPKKGSRNSPEATAKALATRREHLERWGGNPGLRAEQVDAPPAPIDYPPSCGRRKPSHKYGDWW